MSPETRRRAAKRARDPELSVLLTRIPSPRDQEPLTDAELDAFESVDEERDFRIRRHLQPWLCRSSGTFRDARGPHAIDVGVGEPFDGSAWGGLFTIGASTLVVAPAEGGSEPGADRPAIAVPDTTWVHDLGTGRRRRPRRVEFHVRVPACEFHYAVPGILEPLEDEWDAVMQVIGELGRLQHTRGALYRASQIVATPDLAPFVEDLPFAGAWLRDGADGDLMVPPLRVSRHETIDFLPVTLLHPSEVRALLGPDRIRAAARLDIAGIDAVARPERRPVM